MMHATYTRDGVRRLVYAPYEHQSVDADTTNGSLKNDKIHVPFHVTRLD